MNIGSDTRGPAGCAVPPGADLRSGREAHIPSCGGRWEQLGAASDPAAKTQMKEDRNSREMRLCAVILFVWHFILLLICIVGSSDVSVLFPPPSAPQNIYFLLRIHPGKCEVLKMVMDLMFE